MSNTIAIIDYGMGNLHSVSKAVEKVAPNAKVKVTEKPEDILSATRVIFPGVGAIRDCIAELKNRKLDQVVVEVSKEKPLLAVCVGMQALMTHSEENGGVDCLNVLSGEVKLFQGNVFEGDEKLKVPHMGWNKVEQKISHPLFTNIEQNERCYFVHSYYVQAADQSCVAATSEYGLPFHSILSKENIFAVQFHPEKSHRVGLQLLKNFSEWTI
jgi:glutamine amidotransferase